jgi:hypothetical protein
MAAGFALQPVEVQLLQWAMHDQPAALRKRFRHDAKKVAQYQKSTALEALVRRGARCQRWQSCHKVVAVALVFDRPTNPHWQCPVTQTQTPHCIIVKHRQYWPWLQALLFILLSDYCIERPGACTACVTIVSHT